MMQPFEVLIAPAIPMREANLDTDRILPSRFMQKPRAGGFGNYFFHDQRFDPRGGPKADFILNNPAYRDGRILIAGANFGCGSSREQAVYATADYGIRAVIAPSFGDIFYANALKNGLLPIILPERQTDALFALSETTPAAKITIDLKAQTVSEPRGTYPFPIDAFHKQLLLSGQDEIAYTLDFIADIDAFEDARRKISAWL